MPLIPTGQKKYPDTSLGELAEIITMETNKSITKSGINHHFRKINALVKKAKEKQPPDFPIFAAANNIRMGLLYAML